MVFFACLYLIVPGGKYPGEKEITFPPFTCLETAGDPRVERESNGGELIIFSLKVSATNMICRESEANLLPVLIQANVNPKAELANEFEGKRKAVHIGSCKLMREELKEKTAKAEAGIKVIQMQCFIFLLLP